MVQLSSSVQLCVANCSMVQLWFNIGTVLLQLNVASFGASVVQLVARCGMVELWLSIDSVC